LSERLDNESAAGSDRQSEHPRTGESRVTLSPPWADVRQSALFCNVASYSADDAVQGLSEFVDRRSLVHETYIREQAKNKRIGLVLAFALILAASAILTFAPEGRQTISYWIGAALVIFAAGSSGFGRVWGKTKNISFGADQDHRDLGK